MTIENPLNRGFYTVDDAARLIEVGSAKRILGWLRGYPGRSVGPLLSRDYTPLNGREELSFLDLMEIRFVEHFREQGVKVRTLRRVLDNARKQFQTEKPLATSRVRFVPRDDRKDIFVEEVLRPTAEETGDSRLWSLTTNQYEICAFIRDRLDRGVVFDPETQLASRWTPRPDRFPNVIVDPRIAYGRPITPRRVPTQTILEAWKAEGEDIDAVADWFDIPIDEAQMAVEFELSLAPQKRALAA